jgi:hypothetical protein
MIYGMTGVWLTAVVAIAGFGWGSGVSMTIGTATLVLAVGLLPPAIAFKLWGERTPRTIAEILRDRSV